jgi:hypothetical protein
VTPLLPAYDSLLTAPSPAVLTTYRRDGSALTSPVWFRRQHEVLEVVIAAGDIKLKHLLRRPECSLTVFEAVPPFRGVTAEQRPELVPGDVTETRLAIATRYLGTELGRAFAQQRKPDGTILRFDLADVRAWDLSAILPGDPNEAPEA